MKTVTIGIPAHNEEKNIESLLLGLMNQSQEEYSLDRILVVCDGCTDKTEAIVRRFSKTHTCVHVLNDKKRKGKNTRITELLKKNTSDYVILIDADNTLVGTGVIDSIVRTFKQSKASLVSAWDIPGTPRNLLERMAAGWVHIWDETRSRINNGDSLHNMHGHCFGLTASLAKKITVPAEIVCDDQYLYLQTTKLGYTFALAKNAVVTYHLPTTWSDYMLQTVRFLRFQSLLEEYMGVEIRAYYAVPRQAKLQGLLWAFVNNPIFTILGIGLHIVVQLSYSRYLEDYSSGLWKVATSSK